MVILNYKKNYDFDLIRIYLFILEIFSIFLFFLGFIFGGEK